MKPFKIPKNVVFALCTTSSLLIAGCSSSDNSSRPSSSAVAPQNDSSNALNVSSTTITGNVIKGAVTNAEVNFYPIRGNSVAASPLASTQTDASGNFSVTLPTQSLGNAIYVEVLGAADGSSKLICDANVCGLVGEISGDDADGNGSYDFGETVDIASTFTLSTAITDFRSSDNIQISVTPFSHAAVQNARKNGKLSPGALKQALSSLADDLKLPTNLSQILAVDLTKDLADDVDRNSVRYALYSAGVAAYAAKHKLSIEKSVEFFTENLLDASGSVNNELLIELTELAHNEAYRIVKGHPKLEPILSEILLVANEASCKIKGSKGCSGPSKPPVEPPVGELPAVKAFVKDFRTWVRDLATQESTALSNFQARSEAVGELWEDDIKALGAAFNDVLPGIAQALSPNYAFCYYCKTAGGIEFAAAATEKELFIGNLHYLLRSDGSLDVIGSVRDVDVDLRLQFPTREDFEKSHGIEILAGRLSRNNIDLVISKPSHIRAKFPQKILFGDVIDQINADLVPDASEVTADVRFFVEAEYGIAPGGTVSFEEGSALADWLDIKGWQITNEKSSSGKLSLRSEAIGDNEKTSISATINTWGGYLSFDYSIESEHGFDFLNVYVDGKRVLNTSGYKPGFNTQHVFLKPGEHTIVWEYVKDKGVSHNKDAVWLDDIRFPALVGTGKQTVVSQNILSGDLKVTAHKLDQPWQYASKSYLPGKIHIHADLTNQFIVADNIEKDFAHLNLVASIENAATFVPPQPYDEGTLDILGNYTVKKDEFRFNLQEWTIRITRVKNKSNIYRYELLKAGDAEPIQSFETYSKHNDIHKVAGELIENSGIGYSIVVPGEGLYLTTLLKSSPWGNYPESRFNSNGDHIYGYLAEPFTPAETEDQFLKISASFELKLQPYDLPELKFGTSFTRDTLNEGTFDFYIKLDDQKRFNFTSQYWYDLLSYGDSSKSTIDVKSPKLSIYNDNGVKLDLGFADVKNATGKPAPALEGKLIYQGKEYGTIKRVKGITAIEYIDGTGESIE